MNATAKPTVDLSKVASAYSGKDGWCCCGCAGTHYAAEGEDANPTQVKRIVNLLNAANPGDLDHGDNHVALVVGKRIYIAYWKDEPKPAPEPEGHTEPEEDCRLCR